MASSVPSSYLTYIYIYWAILGKKKTFGNEPITLMDPKRIAQNEYMQKYKESKKGQEPACIVVSPSCHARFNVFLNAISFGKVPKILTPYRLRTATANVIYESRT